MQRQELLRGLRSFCAPYVPRALTHLLLGEAPLPTFGSETLHRLVDHLLRSLRFSASRVSRKRRKLLKSNLMNLLTERSRCWKNGPDSSITALELTLRPAVNNVLGFGWSSTHVTKSVCAEVDSPSWLRRKRRRPSVSCRSRSTRSSANCPTSGCLPHEGALRAQVQVTYELSLIEGGQ